MVVLERHTAAAASPDVPFNEGGRDGEGKRSFSQATYSVS